MNYKPVKLITMNSVCKALCLLIISTLSFSTQAQTLEESLTDTYLRMDSVKTLPDMMNVSAQFDLIANKWNDEWISNYYAAYAKAITSFMETDGIRKDLLLDEAGKYLEKTKLLFNQSDSDEIYVLAALITNARLVVDPQSRGREYGQIFNRQLEQAKTINPDNPRIYYLKGTSLFHTPKMFGGGAKAAKPYLEKAVELYAKEDKTSVLKPYWGEKQNLDILNQCDEK